MNDQSLATRAIRGVFWTGSPIVVQLVISLAFFRYLSLEEMGLGHRQRRIDINRPVQQPSLLTAGAGLARAGVGITRQYRQDVGSDIFK